MRIPIALLIAAAVGGCGKGPAKMTTPPPPPPPPDMTAPYPAPHDSLPELVNMTGGPVLTAPKLYLIFYPGYPFESDLQKFAQGLGASTYWSATTQEYGVGTVAYGGMIELTGETPPTTIDANAVETYLAGKIGSGAFGTPDSQTIYTIFYPSSTTITQMGGPGGSSASCTTFGGYHQDVNVTLAGGGTQRVAYAVLPTCSGMRGLTDLQSLTGATSHEWVEAVTDPFPATDNGAHAAFGSVDNDHFIWIAAGGGGEAGDLCVSEADAFYQPDDLPYTVQRTWSNTMAKSGHDPCAPNLPGKPFFDSAPLSTQMVSFTLPSALTGGPPQTVPTRGVVIPVGQSKTIEVDLFSDAPTSGPWSVAAADALSRYTGGAPTVSFKWDTTKGENGDKLGLTVTVTTANPSFSGGHPIIVGSTFSGRSQTWPILIVESAQ
jgi:hypothetical protein